MIFRHIAILLLILSAPLEIYAGDSPPPPKNNRQCIVLLGAMAQFQNFFTKHPFNEVEYSWRGLQIAQQKLFGQSTDRALNDLRSLVGSKSKSEMPNQDWIRADLSRADREKVQRFIQAAENKGDRSLVLGVRIEDPYEIEEFRSFIRDLNTSDLLEAFNQTAAEQKIRRRFDFSTPIGTMLLAAAAYGLHKWTGWRIGWSLFTVGLPFYGIQTFLIHRLRQRQKASPIDPTQALSRAADKKAVWTEAWSADLSLGGVNRAIAASASHPSTPTQVARGAAEYNDFWKTIVGVAQIDQQGLIAHPKFRGRDLLTSDWLVLSGTNEDGSSYLNISVLIHDQTIAPKGGDSAPPPYVGRLLGIDEREFFPPAGSKAP